MQRLSSPSAESSPTLLAANRLFRAPRLSRVARTGRGLDDGFALEGQVRIWSLGLVFDVEWRWGARVSLFCTPFNNDCCASVPFSVLAYATVALAMSQSFGTD